MMGYFRGLRHGALLGVVLGLLYAPDAGTVTRRRVARWLGQPQADQGEAGLSTDGGKSARTRGPSGRFAPQVKREAGA